MHCFSRFSVYKPLQEIGRVTNPNLFGPGTELGALGLGLWIDR
jgi:hypothetical protein